MLERRSDGVWRVIDQAEIDLGAAAEWRTSQRRAQEGELSLLRAILADAVGCFERGHDDARDWFMGEPVEPVVRFSFESLCEHLELDPREIRSLLPTARRRRKRDAPRLKRARIAVPIRRR